MCWNRFIFLAGLVLFLTGAPARAADQTFPADLKALFDKAEKVEMLSLDPKFAKDQPKDAFHGWNAFGKTVVKDKETRKKVLEAVVKGVEDSDGTAARCFNPRHGISVTLDGKTTDFVICFECYQIYVFRDGKRDQTLLTTRSPEKVLDKALMDAGVRLAPKGGK